MEKVYPSEAENAVLDRLDPGYQRVSEMSPYERAFLNALVLRKKPAKILELGISAGGSSVVLLNAAKEIGAELNSIDHSTEYYVDPAKKTGFVVDEYPDLRSAYKLYTDGVACDFMEKIGGGIGFCFIDTVHTLPGEILDYLMVLPYLEENCIVAFHDTGSHTRPGGELGYATGLAMSAVKGRKLHPGNMLPSDRPGDNFPNIGALELAADARDHVWDMFNILTMEWTYLPSNGELERMEKHFLRHYGEEYAAFFRTVVQHQKTLEFGSGGVTATGVLTRLNVSLKCAYYSMCVRFMVGSKRAKMKKRLKRAREMLESMGG